MKFRRRSLLHIWAHFLALKGMPILSFFVQPLGVGILLPVRLRVMGPGKIIVPVFGPFFHLAIRTGRQMQLPRQATAITRPVEKIRNKKFLRRNGLPILSATGGTRISTSQKGSPTRSTHRALTKGIRKAGALRHQSIEGRSLGMWIPKGSQGVESLLIGAKPKDVRSGLHRVGRRALLKFWQESLQAIFKKA